MPQLRIIHIVLISAFCFGGFSSCTTSKSKRLKAQKSLSAEEKKKLIQSKIEMEIGRNMAGRLLQFYGTYQDEDLVGYVNQVGNYVASYSSDPERRYMFEIIDTDGANAFACPGGYILITLGAIRNAKNEAELAHILGHEAAHVAKKHMFDKLQNMSEEEMKETTDEVNIKKQKIPESVQIRSRPDTSSSKTGALMARYLSGSAAGLSVLAAAKAGMSLIMEKGLGAELEYEADSEGVSYAVSAGYDPKAMESYLCRLESLKGRKCNVKPKKKAKAKDILDKTHPPVASRIANINKRLAKMNADEIVGAKGIQRFQKHTKKIPPAKKKKKKKS